MYPDIFENASFLSVFKKIRIHMRSVSKISSSTRKRCDTHNSIFDNEIP